jgi:hypothetical protein
MTVAAEVAVAAWVNEVRGDLTGTLAEPGPLAQGAFTIEQRSPVGAGAYAIVIRQQGPVQRMVAETSDLDCATIVQRDLDDRSSQGHRSPNLDGKNPQTAPTCLQ